MFRIPCRRCVAFLTGLTLALALAGAQGLPAAGRAAPDPHPPDRARRLAGERNPDVFLDDFARSHHPGRSEGVVFVPAPGVCFTTREYPLDHGSPWDYDTEVPLLLYGPGQVRPGIVHDPAAQPRDLPATLSAALGIPPPPGSSGRAWREVLLPGPPLRAILVVVLDQVGRRDLDRLASELPNLGRMRREGCEFDAVRLDFLPTFTVVGHATLSTGALPGRHGVVNYYVPNRHGDGIQEVYETPEGKLDPSWNRLPTLADWMDARLGNRPVVLTQVFSKDAALAFAGHGAWQPGGDRDVVVWYDREAGKPTTDHRWFRLPPYIAARSVADLVARHGPTHAPPGREAWGPPVGGHPLGDVRSTPWFARWEADAMLEMMVREGVGRDEVPDLVQVNLKSTDAIGHRFGHENPSFTACLREVDRFLGAAEHLLRRRAGEGRYLIAVTADHGMAPDEALVRYTEDLTLSLGRTLDRQGDGDGSSAVVFVEGYHVLLDPRELAEEGATPETVRDLLLRDPHVVRAWTSAQVRRRAEELGLLP